MSNTTTENPDGQSAVDSSTLFAPRVLYTQGIPDVEPDETTSGVWFAVERPDFPEMVAYVRDDDDWPRIAQRRADKMEILKAELENIVNATPEKWDDPQDFKEWAKSRARHAIAKANAGREASQPGASVDTP